MVLLATLSFGDTKPQGHKIVLNTFSTLQEASAKMDKIVLSDRTAQLKAKYGFDIVSRSSGKSYILAVEPIQDEHGTQEVLSHFKTVFKDAYSSGYYGPTVGSVFLTSNISEKKAPPPTKSGKHETVDDNGEMNATQNHSPDSPKSEGMMWLWIILIGFPAAGAITGVLIGRLGRR